MIAGPRTSDLEISLLIDMIIPQERRKVHPILCQFVVGFPCEAIVIPVILSEAKNLPRRPCHSA